jgi:hypothetical protein
MGLGRSLAVTTSACAAPMFICLAFSTGLLFLAVSRAADNEKLVWAVARFPVKDIANIATARTIARFMRYCLSTDEIQDKGLER